MIINCLNCNKEVTCYPSDKKKYCSKVCSRLGLIRRYKNEPELKIAVSRVHKGKTLSLKHRKILSDKMKGNVRGKNFSEEIKQKISKKSSEKFTVEYKEKQRVQRIKSGLWIPDEQKSDYKIYCMFSSWDSYLWDLIDSSELIKYGIFNAKTNRQGLVRDHKFSKKAGFELKLFPEILRHPVNCDIMPHSKNSSKRSNNSITLEVLFKLIRQYQGNYKQHQNVLILINQWHLGYRFDAAKYRRKSANE